MKKFLKICGTIACVFVLCLSGLLFTACGKANYIPLEGKTIRIDHFDGLDWDGHALYIYFYDDLGFDGENFNSKTYETFISHAEFVEMFWNANGFAELIGHETSFNSVSEAKNAYENFMHQCLYATFPSFKFSEDGLTITEYAYSDTNFENPIATYNVSAKDNTPDGPMYEFKVPEEQGIRCIRSFTDWISYSVGEGVIAIESLDDFFKNKKNKITLYETEYIEGSGYTKKENGEIITRTIGEILEYYLEQKEDDSQSVFAIPAASAKKHYYKVI